MGVKEKTVRNPEKGNKSCKIDMISGCFSLEDEVVSLRLREEESKKI